MKIDFILAFTRFRAFFHPISINLRRFCSMRHVIKPHRERGTIDIAGIGLGRTYRDDMSALGTINHDGPCGATDICGAGLRWDYTQLGSLLVDPPADGSMVALRLLDAAPRSDPFVWQVDTGDPSRTTMTTTLDMAGHELSNVGELTAGTLVPTTSLQVTGNTETGILDTTASPTPITVGEDMDIAGSLITPGLTADSYDLNNRDAVVSGAVEGNRMDVAGTATLTGVLVVNGSLTTPALTGTLTTDILSMVELEADTSTVDGNVVVNRATTGDLDLDPGRLAVDGILYVSRCNGNGCSGP